MPGSVSFGTSKFADIMKQEVSQYAERYGDPASNTAVGKAFAYWCIKNISPELVANAIERARGICEGAGPGDAHIDGAWTDTKRSMFYIMQAKYSPPVIPEAYDEEFVPPTFGAEAAEDLEHAFFRLTEEYLKGKHPKLDIVEELYRQALKKVRKKKMQIRLIVVVSGKREPALKAAVDAINSRLRADEGKYSRHSCRLLELDDLNEIVSDNIRPPPEPIYLETESDEKFTIPNPDKSTYAMAATVPASELIRIRRENEYRIYHANFRFMLTGKKGVARPKIDATLRDVAERKNFWRYNNGITITCDSIQPVSTSKYSIKGFQVVNGLQTVEALYDNSLKSTDWISDVKVLVRIIPTEGTIEDPTKLEIHIAEYSNSQSPITPRNLRANDPVQREIERIVDEVYYPLKWIRKVGEEPTSRGRRREDEIQNEEAAQAALAFWCGKAYEAKAAKRLLFETTDRGGYYEDVFSSTNEQYTTTAEYLLLPYLLWDSQYKSKFIRKQAESVRADYQRLDLLALSVVGEAFRRSCRIPREPVRVDDVRQLLQKVVTPLVPSPPNRWPDRHANKLWGPVFKALYAVAKTMRHAEARRRRKREKGISDEDIPMRNIILRMRFDKDSKLKAMINRRQEIRRLPKVIKDVLGP